MKLILTETLRNTQRLIEIRLAKEKTNRNNT